MNKINHDQLLSLEHPFVKIPVEKFRSSLRVSQKHIEKEIATLTNSVSDISKKSAQGNLDPKQVEVALEAIVNRLSTLKRKLKDTRAEEVLYSQRTKARLQHLQDFTTITSLDSDDFARWSRVRLNRILIDYMLRDGFRESASLLAKSEQIEDLVDIELFVQSAKVEQALMRQSCTECLQWCKENSSNLKKIKSMLEFSLRMQEFIELARERRSQEAIAYAQKHLTPWHETHLLEINRVMALLAFPPETKCHPYKRLYDQSRWNDLISQFRSNNFALQFFTPEPLLNVTLQAGLSALKTPMCYQPDHRNINCPVCDPDTLGALATDLPLSHHFNSSIVCRISGEIMNEDNLPMALPNGYVYSYNALVEMASLNNGKITCPRTGIVYDISQMKKGASTPSIPSLDHVIDTNDPTVRALIQAAVAHQQQQEAAAAAAAVAAAAAMVKAENPSSSIIKSEAASSSAAAVLAATSGASASATPLSHSVPVDILQSLLPSVTSGTFTVSASALASIAAGTSAAASPPSAAAPTSILTVTPTPTLNTAAKPATSSTTPDKSSGKSSSSLSSSRPSTKRFHPDDIFCLGCCRNLSIDHYTCPTTNRVFKSCNACRQKSRINSKKVVKPVTVPTKPTISMEEFGARLRELEATQEESSLDVMVHQPGSVEMDQETLKARGAQIAAQVYESTGYWFSHSRTNDETQSKTRLKIYGCSQREDRRAPPAPKTQSRKRNRPSTKRYFPCKGNLTMTFYHKANHVRVVYGHKRHDKYDNRKCPDHVRAYVRENLNLPPRQIYDNLVARDPSLQITQAQVRYWSHFYKRSGGQEGNETDHKDDMHDHNDEDHGSSHGSPSMHQEADQQTEEERVQHEQVQQLLLASNAAALQSLAQSHQASQSLVGGPIAISVPMSDMDTQPLSSSIVQRVLAEDGGKSLLQLQASLNAVSSAASSAGENGDAVVQQVSDFMKENDQQALTPQQ